MKFIVAHGAGKELTDTDTIRWFLKESEAWDQTVIDTATYAETKHAKTGIMVVVSDPVAQQDRASVS